MPSILRNDSYSEHFTKNISQLTVFKNFDCYFLKKEKLYTKLKYSRSPQYDIVSGGVAALFSAFIGFLISEKFGIELVDSGDFYIVFMYGVFITFSVRPIVRMVSKFDKKSRLLSALPLISLISTFCNFFIYKATRLNIINYLIKIELLVLLVSYFSRFICTIVGIVLLPLLLLFLSYTACVHITNFAIHA